MKLTTRCGEAAVTGLNEALLAKAAGVKADLHGPAGAGGGRRHPDPGAGPAPGCCPADARDRRQAADPRQAGPGRKRDVRRALPAALSGRMRGRLRRALDELAVAIGRTATVVARARSRLAGQVLDGATRLVSLHDGDARPIRKGRIDQPVEFGYKAQVIDNDDGIVVDYGVQAGNPADAPQLAPAISRIARRAGRPPRSVTADRGYGEPATEQELQALGVHTVAIPRRAKPSADRCAVGHAPASAGSSSGGPAAKEPPSGADTGFSPTTWSRSVLLPADPIWPRTASRAQPAEVSPRLFRTK